MAKRLFLLAVGALALTACTSEDVVEDVTTSRNVIKFENVVNKPSRADITSSSLTHFNVFGFYTLPGNDQHAHQVFYNVPVERPDADGNWEYTGGERYWIPGAKYYFYAYSCNNTGISENVVSGIDYTMDMEGEKDASARLLEIQNYLCDDDHQHDLIFASNTGAVEGNQFAGIEGLEENNQAVALQFKHILSKIKAKFTTKFPTEYEIVISDISIQSIRNRGNYDVTNKWHSLNGSTALSLYATEVKDDKEVAMPSIMVKNAEVGDDDNKKQMSAETAQFYVIPNGSDDADGVSYALKFTIDVYLGSDRTEKIMSKTLTGAFTPAWAEGYQYVYNVDINGDTTHMQVIAFTTSVDAFGVPEVGAETEIKDFNVTDNGVN